MGLVAPLCLLGWGHHGVTSPLCHSSITAMYSCVLLGPGRAGHHVPLQLLIGFQY